MGGCAAAADSDAGDFLPFDRRIAELRPFTSLGVKRSYFGLIYIQVLIDACMKVLKVSQSSQLS